MKKRNTFVAILALAVCLCAALPSLGSAEEATHPVGFTAKAILPDNQLGNGSYFNLLIGPSKQQTIEVQLDNHLSEPLTVSIAVYDAHTNQNGLIAYTGEVADASGAKPWAVSAIATPLGVPAADGTLRITLGPLESIRLPIALATPDMPLDGQTLGGIVITKVESAAEQENGAFAVRSTYSYAIALQLQSTQVLDTQPEVALLSAAKTSVVGWDALSVAIENRSPLVISGASIHLLVYPQGSEQPVLDITNTKVSMAPSSIMPYTAMLPEGKTLAPGQYTAQVDWTYGGETTTLEINFTI